MTTTYTDFLREKVNFDRSFGFDVPAGDIHPILKPHQRDIVRWAVAGGRRAIFASFGLGKSVMQLEILRLITAHKGGSGLIICPLGVRQEFIRDARMLNTTVTFIRSAEQMTGPGIYITNYETVRDDKLDPNLFDAVSLDEASVLRSYGSKTYQTFLTLFADVTYRFVATATPSPNRYKELIHYAGFLGVMDTGQALTRFFQRDSTQANNLTLYPHKVAEFHLWLNSWSIFLQKPSDICRCTCHDSTSTFKTNDSASSSPSSGRRAPAGVGAGSVDATAEEIESSRRPTSEKDGHGVADVCGLSTAARAPGHTQSGAESSTAAPGRSTRTGPTTEAGASPSASGGERSPTSSPTWENRRTDSPSTGSTTTGTTSPATAAGPTEQSKQETVVHDGDACPCDLGYDLPDIEVVYHEVPVDHSMSSADRDGQEFLFRGGALGVSEASREKRDTITSRVAKTAEIVAASPDDHFILWHDLEDERRALKRALPEAVEVFGTLDLDEREQRIIAFSDGEVRILATKPELSGSGCNFQRHCHRAIYTGVGFKFNDFYQSLHRIQRFQQPHKVRVDIIYAESEREVIRTLQAKWAQHEELTAKMTDVIRAHGLNQTSINEALTRAMGIERIEASGIGWTVANNDCVDETARMEDDSVDLIVTSIPFSNHYEYTPSYNDFGHTDGNDHFWQQMDYLTPHLLRVLRPGRIYACHVKDRILFGNVTGAGIPTVSPFHAEALMHGRRHGFDFLGMITVVTDVVRENNQTYRLGWSEQCKDGTKMGVGSPEYILLFHKPQTDRTKGYADVPVTKCKGERCKLEACSHEAEPYTRARWQLDAHAFWRSSGNRHLTPDEIAAMPADQMSALFTAQTLSQVYDYESHVRIGEVLEGRGALPATFMSLAPGSHHPDVWHDVNRMLTLNTEQSRRAQVMHVCPLQFDIVDRLILRYSNEGETVYDPFGGLFTVPVRALRAGRVGRAVELNPGYFLDGVAYLKAEERRVDMPSLFDLEPPEAGAA